MHYSSVLPKNTLLSLLISLFFSHTNAAVNKNWTSPNGIAGDFTTVWDLNQTVTVSWSYLNNTISDLWLTAYTLRSDFYGYQHELKAGINISVPGTYTWSITQVNNTDLAISDQFVLRFIPRDTAYYSFSIYNIESPAFVLQNLSADASSTPISTSTAASTAITSPTSSSSAAPAPSSLPTTSPFYLDGDKTHKMTVPIAVGVILGALAVVGITSLVFLYRRRRRRGAYGSADGTSWSNDTQPDRPEMMDATYRNDSGAPKELQGIESQVYEAPTLGQGFPEMGGREVVHEMEGRGVQR